MARHHKISEKITDFKTTISPSSKLRFDQFLFFKWVIFQEELRYEISFLKFYTNTTNNYRRDIIDELLSEKKICNIADFKSVISPSFKI